MEIFPWGKFSSNTAFAGVDPSNRLLRDCRTDHASIRDSFLTSLSAPHLKLYHCDQEPVIDVSVSIKNLGLLYSLISMPWF